MYKLKLKGLLVVSVDQPENTQKSFTEANTVILWNALDFTRRTYGQPKQVGALTLSLSLSAAIIVIVTARGSCVLESAKA